MMADNPNKKEADAKGISKQPHEQAYQALKKKKATRKRTSRKANA
jgi:hypothetical protein